MSDPLWSLLAQRRGDGECENDLVAIGILQRGPEDERERRYHGFGAATEADNLKALNIMILQGASQCVEKVGEIGGEAMTQVGEAKPVEYLGCRAAQFYVVTKAFKLKGLDYGIKFVGTKVHPASRDGARSNRLAHNRRTI